METSCPNCGYSKEGLPSDVCPECGLIYGEARRRRRSRLSGAVYVFKCCLMAGPLTLIAFRINDRIAEHRLFEAQSLVVLLACMVGFAVLRLRGAVA